jgi:hypothetical protein
VLDPTGKVSFWKWDLKGPLRNGKPVILAAQEAEIRRIEV